MLVDRKGVHKGKNIFLKECSETHASMIYVQNNSLEVWGD